MKFRLYNLQEDLLERTDFSSLSIDYSTAGNSKSVDLTYFDDINYFESPDLPWLSADNKIKEFILVYDGNEDTLNVDIMRFRNINSNCDSFQTIEVLFNADKVELNRDQIPYLYNFHIDK